MSENASAQHWVVQVGGASEAQIADIGRMNLQMGFVIFSLELYIILLKVLSSSDLIPTRELLVKHGKAGLCIWWFV